jgi:hypothetical protein
VFGQQATGESGEVRGRRKEEKKERGKGPQVRPGFEGSGVH